MSNIEKIKAEIERLKNIAENDNASEYLRGQARVCRVLLDFIDSLPEETCKDSLQVHETCKENQDSFTSLEEAAKEYASKTLCDPDDGPSTGLAKESFIAGAEWQKEQKPAEWSEEDEKDMAHIIRILDDCYVYGTHDLSKTDYENLVNKLKSLRPSWKPNEEQMKALHRCVDYLHGEGSGYFDPINSLYKQLKKL